MGLTYAREKYNNHSNWVLGWIRDEFVGQSSFTDRYAGLSHAVALLTYSVCTSFLLHTGVLLLVECFSFYCI